VSGAKDVPGGAEYQAREPFLRCQRLLQLKKGL
jgi:hypothetical protein